MCVWIMMKTCLVPLTQFNQCFNVQWCTYFVKLTFNMMPRVIVLKFWIDFESGGDLCENGLLSSPQTKWRYVQSLKEMRGLSGGCTSDKQKFIYMEIVDSCTQAGSLLLAVTGEVMFYKSINMHMPAKQWQLGLWNLAWVPRKETSGSKGLI